jgi:hypothetical protein
VRATSSGLSTDVLQELASDLKKTQQALEVELAGMKGRATALQEEVAKTAARVRKDPTDDEVVRNLKRVLELRASQLEVLQTMFKAGAAATQVDVMRAEEQVALAQVELAQAKEANRRSASDRLEKLNDDLAQIATSVAETEAKLDHVNRRLEEHSQLLDRETEAQPLREKLAADTANLVSFKAAADQAVAKVRQLESTFRPTRIEVFELSVGEEKPPKGEAEKR